MCVRLVRFQGAGKCSDDTSVLKEKEYLVEVDCYPNFQSADALSGMRAAAGKLKGHFEKYCIPGTASEDFSVICEEVEILYYHHTSSEAYSEVKVRGNLL